MPTPIKPIVMRSLGGSAPLRPSTDEGRIAGAATAAATALPVRLRKRRRLINSGFIIKYRINCSTLAKPILTRHVEKR
jgi:hypothetical protein